MVTYEQKSNQSPLLYVFVKHYHDDSCSHPNGCSDRISRSKSAACVLEELPDIESSEKKICSSTPKMPRRHSSPPRRKAPLRQSGNRCTRKTCSLHAQCQMQQQQQQQQGVVDNMKMLANFVNSDVEFL